MPKRLPVTTQIPARAMPNKHPSESNLFQGEVKFLTGGKVREP